MERFSALIGFVVILGIAWGLSNNKKSIRWKTVGWGLLLQIVIAICVLKGELIARAEAAGCIRIGCLRLCSTCICRIRIRWHIRRILNWLLHAVACGRWCRYCGPGEHGL